MGPSLAFQLALRVELASWFPIQVEICTPLGNHMGAGAHEQWWAPHRIPPRGDWWPQPVPQDSNASWQLGVIFWGRASRCQRRSQFPNLVDASQWGRKALGRKTHPWHHRSTTASDGFVAFIGLGGRQFHSSFKKEKMRRARAQRIQKNEKRAYPTPCPKTARNILMYVGAVGLWRSLGRDGCLGCGLVAETSTVSLVLWARCCMRGGRWVEVSERLEHVT